MAGADQAHRCHKEILEVEAMVCLVGRLNHHAIKVIQDHGDVWNRNSYPLTYELGKLSKTGTFLTYVFDVVKVLKAERDKHGGKLQTIPLSS